MSAKIKEKNPDAGALERETKKADPDTSDHALLVLLERIKATTDPNEIRELSHQLERAIFHKQFK